MEIYFEALESLRLIPKLEESPILLAEFDSDESPDAMEMMIPGPYLRHLRADCVPASKIDDATSFEMKWANLIKAGKWNAFN
ncbi:hypothetical protein BKA69DRAFT_1123452 [Paraphysoderma sedebokerense]|nr:hypothetical protein BKA69DRAFT_1123452 [Paraphysoderma sedebokerense]